ncbi:MAG: dockerin type I repeat-containing protein [Planctomycetota bacterium]
MFNSVLRLKTAGLLLAIAGVFAARTAVATDTLVVGTGSGDPGTTVTIPVTGTNDDDLHAYSLAVTYPVGEGIDCTAVTLTGTVVTTALGATPPDYFSTVINPATGVVITGVILEFTPIPGSVPVIPASPTTAQTFANLVFDIDSEALPGTHVVSLINGIGSPPINNTFSSAGVSVLPALTGGNITINNEYRMYFNNLTLGPGGSGQVIINVDHPEALQGYQVGIIYNSAQITVNGFPSGSAQWWQGLLVDLLMTPTPSGPDIEVFTTSVIPSLSLGMGWVGVGAVFDFVPPFAGQMLPPGNGHSILRVPVTVNGSLPIGTCPMFQLASGFGSPTPLDNLCIISGGQGVIPFLDSGIVCVGNPPPFRRGDTNSDTALNIADAIYLVQYIFVGGTQPSCFDAADSNDDSTVNVADVIYILNGQFSGGAPPPAPFPSCGNDPTADALGCGFYPTC